MAQNLFEELQERKQKLIAKTQKATEFGWITPERQKEILEKLEHDTLTIGVIGQMKCGKSTFLNSFVFEDAVLPAATTPMTAALSVITYGAEKKLVAEFYTKDEWEEQRMQASRSLSDVEGNPIEESKVKAAKELMEKASKLGGDVSRYLGKTKEDSFDNLIEYVGAEGKFISITKAVTIYYPKEYLKGVEIVDTPGFNDPIVSREERTKSFLKKADVVLMMLYAGRPFDATDRNILFQNVRQCGIGKVIIGINKYDIPYENGETEEEIKDYVKSEIKKACRACNDETLVDILREAEPVPLSAEMALLSELPMSKITNNEAFQFAWKRACDNFEISTQVQMREKSHLTDLTDAIKRMVENEKGKILFAKPLNAILAAGNRKKEENEKEIRECDSLISNLNKPDDELEEQEKDFNKAEKRLSKKIDGLGDSIEESFDDLIRKKNNELEDIVDASCKEMKRVIDDWGRFDNIDKVIQDIDAKTQFLVTRSLKYSVQNFQTEVKNSLQKCIKDFFEEAEEVLEKYIEDYDSRDVIKGISRNVNLDIVDKDLFSFDNSTSEDEYGFWDGVFDFLNGASYGTLALVGNAISHSENQTKLRRYVDCINNEFKPDPYLSSIKEKKDEIINMVKQGFFEEFLHPLQEQLKEIRKKSMDKEQTLKEAKEKLVILKQKRQEIEVQLQEIM
mgnify:CR=1 FL=1